ncbi:MAG TPA: DMT family transporter [Oscillospiraceae bacterium]|nr:DMT family transporter [Oscillospiraceae bacterium]
MYYLASAAAGAIIAVMVVQNGALADLTGLFGSTVLVHLGGLVFVVLCMFARRVRLPRGRMSWYLYGGGAVGVASVVFTSYAFAHASVSAITALALLGQSVYSLAIDHFGWFGLPRRPFRREKLAGLAAILAGIACILWLRAGPAGAGAPAATLPAIFLAFLSGITVVTTRMLNSGLCERTGLLPSTLWNYITGLTLSLLLLPAAGGAGQLVASPLSPNVFLYLGGVSGAVVVLFSSSIAPHISSLYMTIFMFVGQVFTGVLLDVFLTGAFSAGNAAGGILVTLGLVLMMRADAKNGA